MSINLNRLRKSEILWLYNNKCQQHGMRYLEHPACYGREKPDCSLVEERVGFLDIEASNLNANFGVILSWCIKIRGGDIIYGVLNDKDFRGKEAFKVDKRIIGDLVKELGNFDRIVGHYSRKFDIPFIRTRALIDGITFPEFGCMVNDDTYYMAKFKLRLNSNRLEMVARTLLGKSEKTHLDGATWIAASRGDHKALDYILKHNIIDVEELEKIWEILKGFVGKQNTSI